MTNTTMTIKAAGTKLHPGTGFVMFGRQDSGKWFERWFATETKAAAHATRKQWTVALS